MHRTIALSVGSRAVRALTAARARAGALPGRNQSTAFLGPEPTGEAAQRFHVREERSLSTRLREFFVYSPALGRTVGVRVLLPGVPQETADVVYLLHGGGDDFRSWTDFGDAEAITADSPYLVVMPDAGAAGYSRHALEPGDPAASLAAGAAQPGVLDWPRFHTEELPAFVEDRFSVSAERSGRIVAGLSMGGYGAMKYAAVRPDRYCAAAAFSSPLDPLSAPPLFEIIALREGGSARSLFGDPKRDRAEWEANSPLSLAANLSGADLWFTAGSGDPDPGSEDPVDLLETEVSAHGERFHAALDDLGIAHTWLPRETGVHSWPLWQRELREWITALPDRLAEAAASRPAAGTSAEDGAPFSHLSGDPVFSVRGWDVAISRRRAQLVAFADVSPSGFSLTGSGTFRVRTPGLFHPGERYEIAVSSPLAETTASVRADARGRLDITGRMAGALHDPIVPGRRTRGFREFGSDAVTEVAIRPASAQTGRAPQPVDQARGMTAEADSPAVVRSAAGHSGGHAAEAVSGGEGPLG